MNSKKNWLKYLNDSVVQIIKKWIHQSAFENQDHSIHFEWIELLLTSYYDKMYDYQLERKQDRCIKSGNWEMIRNFLNNSNQL